MATDKLYKHRAIEKLVVICGLKYKYLINITPRETKSVKGLWFWGPVKCKNGGMLMVNVKRKKRVKKAVKISLETGAVILPLFLLIFVKDYEVTFKTQL